MVQSLGAVTLLVHDYDDAIGFYTDKVGFDLVGDTPLGDGKRWVLLAPPGSGETRLLLARADGDSQRSRVGDQTGGRDYDAMVKAGVRFREAPRREPYGTVAVFEDLYGNLWDLIQSASQDRSSRVE
jgi:catechol 2,3-dioxygenase-like lactoylglutathione lyase family enzyme